MDQHRRRVHVRSWFRWLRSGSRAPDNAPAATTLSRIGSEMEAFTGKTVTVSADAITDMRHLTLLVDKACPDTGFHIVWHDCFAVALIVSAGGLLFLLHRLFAGR